MAECLELFLLAIHGHLPGFLSCLCDCYSEEALNTGIINSLQLLKHKNFEGLSANLDNMRGQIMQELKSRNIER